MNNEMLTKIVEDFETMIYKILDRAGDDIAQSIPEVPVFDDKSQSSQGSPSQEDPSLSNVDEDEEERNISQEDPSQGGPSQGGPSQEDPPLSNLGEEGNIPQGSPSQGEPPPTEVKFNELLNIDVNNNEQVQELEEIVNREQEKVINNLEGKNSIDEFLNF